MNHPPGMTTNSAEHSFSPIDNEPPLRWQRKLGLAPANGLGVMRRAMLLAGLAWFVPLIWAALNHRLWEGAPGSRCCSTSGFTHVSCLRSSCWLLPKRRYIRA